MPYRNPQSLSCTAAEDGGKFCNAESLPDAPFPICVKHAAEVMRYINSCLPRTTEDRVIMAAGALRGDRARRAPKEDRHERQSVVYYLRVGANIKIGTTTNLTTRLRGYPPDSKILAVEPGGLSVEKRRHIQFRDDLRHGNEWFAPSPALMDHINALREAAAA